MPGAELAMLLRARDEGVAAVFNEVKGHASGLGSALSNALSTAGGFVIGGAITALPGFLMDSAKAAADDEQATARLSQTVKNLGGDYDAVMGSVNDAIAAGQKLAFTDDDVRDSFQFLANATGDSDEAMRRQSAAMDLARGAHIPLSQATKMLGKMTDENVNTFKKLGIELPKNATEAEALAAVQAQFAGQADAYANSTAGQFEQAQIALSETKEALGAAVLPIMAKLGQVLVSVLPALQDFAGVIGPGIGAAVESTMAVLSPLAEAAGGLVGIFNGASEPIEHVRELLNTFFPPSVSAAIIGAVADLGDLFTQVFDGNIAGALDAAQRILANFGSIISGLVEGWASAFAAWVDGADTEQAGKLAEMAVNLLGWIQTTAAAIVVKLAVWAGAFVDWIAPKIPGVLEALGGFLAAMAGWLLGTGLPALLGHLAAWGLALVEWVAPRIPPLLAALAALLVELGTWMLTTALPAIVAKLLEWGTAFAAWVPGALVGLLFEMGKLEVELINWVGTVALPAIVGKLVEWGGAFLGWVAKDVLPTLPAMLGAILTSIAGWVASSVTAVAESAKAIGSSMLTGIQNGISGALGAFWSWLQSNFVDKIPTFIIDILGLKHDTGALAMVGERMIEELKIGIGNRWPSLEDLMDRLLGGMGGTVGGNVDDWLKAAMQITGVGSDWLSGLRWLVAHESSGDPRAKNPNSTASGLFQLLDSTWAGSRDKNLPDDIWNPIINAVAGIRYIASRYGSPAAAVDFWKKHNYYAEGGWAGLHGPELAVLGERGPEYVVPNSRIGGGSMLDEARLAAAIVRGINATRPINLYGTTEELARQVRRQMDADQMNLGLLRGAR